MIKDFLSGVLAFFLLLCFLEYTNTQEYQKWEDNLSSTVEYTVSA